MLILGHRLSWINLTKFQERPLVFFFCCCGLAELSRMCTFKAITDILSCFVIPSVARYCGGGWVGVAVVEWDGYWVTGKDMPPTQVACYFVCYQQQLQSGWCFWNVSNLLAQDVILFKAIAMKEMSLSFSTENRHGIMCGGGIHSGCRIVHHFLFAEFFKEMYLS